MNRKIIPAKPATQSDHHDGDRYNDISSDVAKRAAFQRFTDAREKNRCVHALRGYAGGDRTFGKRGQ